MAAMTSVSTPARWWRLAAVWAGVWVFLILQIYLEFGWPEDSTAHFDIWFPQFTRCLVWAALTPFVLRLHAHISRLEAGTPIKILCYLFWMAVLVLAVSQLRAWLYHAALADWNWEDWSPLRMLRGLGRRQFFDIEIYWIIIAWAKYRLVQSRLREAELREERHQTDLARAELAALRHQVQPHFLFNSLNAVAGLVREGRADRAVESLAQLSGLLRLLITTAGRLEVDLALELDYAQRYLAVEQLRFGDRLRAEFDVAEDCLPALMPTLLLQPILENAIKHGIARRASPGRVSVHARCDGGLLRLEVANDPAEDARPPAEGHGVGLQSTAARLRRAYGDIGRLEWRVDSARGTVVRLALPFHIEPRA